MQFLEIFVVIFKATGIQNVPYSVVKKSIGKYIKVAFSKHCLKHCFLLEIIYNNETNFW